MAKLSGCATTSTGEQFSVAYTAEGQSNRLAYRQVRRHFRAAIGNPVRDGYQGTTTPYKIEGGKVVTNISQDPYSVTVYKLGDTYYGARSNEFGYANYEMIPSPQFVQNPVTAMLNQFSIELGLTEQQRQQILPFLQDEVKQLGALKKNTSLKPMDKLEQLKKIADDVDAKVTPLLDQQQQQKFQAIREEHRRELLEKMGSQVMEKAEAKVKSHDVAPVVRKNPGQAGTLLRWIFSCGSRLARPDDRVQRIRHGKEQPMKNGNARRFEEGCKGAVDRRRVVRCANVDDGHGFALDGPR